MAKGALWLSFGAISLLACGGGNALGRTDAKPELTSTLAAPSARVAEPAVASAPAPAPQGVAPSAPAEPLAEIHGETIAQGPSLAGSCSIEILARALTWPAKLIVGPDGSVYVVDEYLTKFRGENERRTRVLELKPGSRPRRVADFVAALSDVALHQGGLAYIDRLGDGEVGLLDLQTGKRTHVGPGPRDIAARSGALYGTRFTPDRLEIFGLPTPPETASGVIATIAGRWDPDTTWLVTSSTRFYFLVTPGREDARASAGSFNTHLAHARLSGGEAQIVGKLHIGTALAAASPYVYAGSLTRVFRIDETTMKIETTTGGGAEQMAADANGGAWTNADQGTVTVWPKGELPRLACEGIASAAGIALSPTHVYFSSMGEDPLAGKSVAVVGRFKR